VKGYQAIMRDIFEMRHATRLHFGTKVTLRGRIRTATYDELEMVYLTSVRDVSRDHAALHDIAGTLGPVAHRDAAGYIFGIPLTFDAFVPEGVIVFETTPIVHNDAKVRDVQFKISMRYEVEVSLV
jgi:hypothetical protein